MKPPRSALPLESFSPELTALLLAGCTRRIAFDAAAKGPLGSPKFLAELSRFRLLRKRLWALRARLRELGDERGRQFYRCQITIGESVNRPHFGQMILEPRDDQFADLLSSAGAKVPELPPDFTLDTTDDETTN